MIKIKKTNISEVVVIPEKPWLSERSEEEEYKKAEELKASIERHVDDIGEIYINTKCMYGNERGGEFNTLYDVLANQYYYIDECYEYQYVLPNADLGIRECAFSFRELIETAYRHPWQFELKESSVELTQEKKMFLQKVIEVGLKDTSK
ncbi:hypothetical protein EEL30_21710 [Brevibacillus laterosporus]|uniref:Uncharacterized protein n=1 Tax=Brevibacillus laterosporus TaxID=1465 RepID=A0A518VCD7_BRELA|nr:hypothetical protein EEL30_21710 [Brevibacillus laterosporus]